MKNENASKNQLISTHVDDGQLIKNFISTNINMNEIDLTQLSKADLIKIILQLKSGSAKEIQSTIPKANTKT